MVIDACIFAGYGTEPDLLDIRMRELDPVVDRFVVAEAAQTFSGAERALIFPGVRDRYAAFERKIVYVQRETLPGVTPWEREHALRNAVLDGLRDVPDDAMVLLSDVDEIPAAAAIPQQMPRGIAIAFEQTPHCYDLRTTGAGVWYGTRMSAAYEMLVRSPQAIRHYRRRTIKAGGWHFSSMGGVAAIQEKLRAYAHQEYRHLAADAAELWRRASAPADLFGNSASLTRHATLAHLPACVRDDPQRWAHLLATYVPLPRAILHGM